MSVPYARQVNLSVPTIFLHHCMYAVFPSAATMRCAPSRTKSPFSKWVNAELSVSFIVKGKEFDEQKLRTSMGV